MDVHCSTCEEPWDTFHLWQDAIDGTSLSKEEAKAWYSLPSSHKLSDHYRQLFRESGWEFGRSVINVLRCPGCPKDAKPDLERMQAKAAVEELLGEDEDAIAVTFEDHRL